MNFVDIAPANEHFVDEIYPGDEERFWVHYNSYWLENSRTKEGIAAYLIYVDDQTVPVGFIAYGQFYKDEELTRPRKGWYEVAHLVIAKKFQGRGYGRQATLMAINALRSKEDFEKVVIAYHPDNIPARNLYRSLGFVETGEVNYDGDPLLQLTN